MKNFANQDNIVRPLLEITMCSGQLVLAGLAG
jgi:hypothetical protein